MQLNWACGSERTATYTWSSEKFRMSAADLNAQAFDQNCLQ